MRRKCNRIKRGSDEMKERVSHLFKASESQTYFGSICAGEDLMDKIIELCEQHGIRSGMVTCIGSLKQAGFTVFKMKNGCTDGYAPPTVIAEPVELIQATGFICEDEHGKLDLHLHGIIEKQDETVSAGHFLRGYNKVCITAEYCVISAGHVTGKRHYDPSLGYKVINFHHSGVGGD
ncbi:hypothetical protein CHI09_04250 [Shouchella clausii]|nr:hypothetical protein CHI09_04250 [Shouchella clausii]